MILLQPPRLFGDERQQLTQLKDYLGALIPQLNLALEQATRQEYTLQTAQPQAIRAQKEQQAAATFADVKSLIIKSADIVNAWYDAISLKLQGLYVAQSDFGTYREETALLLEASARQVELLFENDQTMATEFSNLQATANDLRATSGSLSADMETVKAQGQAAADSLAGLEGTAAGLAAESAALKSAADRMDGQLAGLVADNLLTKAYIRMGLLDTEEGMDIYGLEIGQTVEANGTEVFAKCMRLSAGQLTFYNGDDSVAAVASGDRFLCPVLEAQKLYLGGFSLLPRTNGNLSVRWTK